MDMRTPVSTSRKPTLTQSELERHLWHAADILRGHVDAGKFKDYIFALLFYRRLCDVWNEEFEALLDETGNREDAADPDEHRFHVPPQHHWSAVRKHATQIGQHLNNAFAAVEDANLRLRGVFGDVDFANQERFPDARLERLLAHFEKHRLRNSDVPPDMLGDAYMYLIEQFAEGAGKKGGEFYTPRQVVKLIVECLDPQPGMSIYDPTCGSGGMLLEAVGHLKAKGQDPRSLSLYGQEKELDTWAIAQINLFLHDIDDAFIAKGDTILDPKRYDPRAQEFTLGIGAYDRVLANPPFSVKVWGHEVWTNGDPFGRDVYGVPPKGYGDLAFVQHMVASLKDDGILGVVVPHGVLFRGGAEGRIREAMLKADIIEAVIGLAPNLFYGATIPTAILIIRKAKPAGRKGKVLVVNGDATFTPGTAQNHLTDANVRKLADTFHAFVDVEKLARVVPVGEIATNGFNLNISGYVQTGADAEHADWNSETARLSSLIRGRQDVEAEMFRQLACLVEAREKVDWPMVSLREAASTFFNDGDWVESKDQDPDGDVRLIQLADIGDGEFLNKSNRFLTSSKAAQLRCSFLKPGDILISRMADPIGRCCVYPGLGQLAATVVDVAIVRPDPMIDRDFLAYAINAPSFRTQVVNSASGTTRSRVSRGNLGGLMLPLPPLGEQKRIARVISSIDEALVLSCQISGGSVANSGGSQLRRLKDALVSSLMSGHLRVSS